MATPIVVAGKAAEAAAGVGAGLVKAATTPIISRKKLAIWNDEEERWIPVERETEVNITPAAVGTVVVGGAVALYATGLALKPRQVPRKVKVSNPAYESWQNQPPHVTDTLLINGQIQRIESGRSLTPPPKEILVDDPTGATHTKLAIVSRPRGLLYRGDDSTPSAPAESGPASDTALFLLFGPLGLALSRLFGR